MTEPPREKALSRTLAPSLWRRWRDLGRDRALTARPQTLGFLPTWTFWRRLDVARASWPLFVLLGIPMALFLGLSGAFGLHLPWWGIAVVLIGYTTLMEGLVERYLRRQIRKRQDLAPDETRALGPAAEHR